MAMGLSVLAGITYQSSIIWGICMTAFAFMVVYLNLPMLLILRESLLVRRLPRLAMLFWLYTFDILKFPRTTLIYINNRVTGRITVHPGDVHVMVSRCLQNSECKLPVAKDINNCQECGRCKIGLIKGLCSAKHLSFTVESGGTSARRRLKSLVPKLVIAVACERELVAGIMDTYLPVVGVVLKAGPQPCTDSDVVISELEERLNSAVKEV